ncbi:DUF4436 domain-containing protein [Mycobacterium tuberculosis]|uniref:DUF4436 domain-containing protein n=1 Tax=Mycobacterium tuberculosis TaxID=1773 RepID=UPI00045ADFB6|nr:DUF4436 domain-containing protein [Mycobacterium tuberculosis]KAM53887.1 transmembrane protein [Mycobacterium tuberculosis TKK_05MA_0009]KAV21931.1 transmembrane protein [Mycobacterium tuberculosis TKK_05MA_0058]KAW24086.1 transmembrane protein [Mycobacterium tuberculosis TKK_05SA_0058]KBV63932.1 transmembrane protein [Mycobacterium tuberculosis TKK-01-0032]KBY21799.1 transmembrane protein [Mycobacterium tuberculosis TKK-01-0009]
MAGSDPPTGGPASQAGSDAGASPEHKHMSRRKHLVLDVCIILGVLIAYVFSLLGYDWLAHTPGPLPQPDVGTTDDTVVLIRFEELHTVANRLDVKVLVLPDDSMIDHRLQVLTTDTSVRLYPENELRDLQYPVGKLPAQVATTIEAHGNPGAWPFDTYTTDTVQADVLVGAGDNRQYVPARVEVTGSLEGWDISAVRVGESSQTSDRPDNVIITLKRAKGPLVFDLGICLVLITLPTLALFVAIQMITGRRKFQPPFGTWYAAMLFAVVPLRTILPGSPPAGAWIDRAVVIWVLIALAAAMVVYIVAWYRESD